MRRLIFAFLLTAAPLLMFDPTPASACGWYGGYGYRGYAPRAYSYRRGAYTGAGVYGWRGWGGRGWRW
jgi:hypothetical protein